MELAALAIFGTLILLAVGIGFAMGRETINKSIIPKKKVKEDERDNPNFFDINA